MAFFQKRFSIDDFIMTAIPKYAEKREVIEVMPSRCHDDATAAKSLLLWSHNHPLNILCDAVILVEALGEKSRKRGMGAVTDMEGAMVKKRRVRMGISHKEQIEMIGLATKLSWEKTYNITELERAGILQFCLARPNKVSVEQFLGWMIRNKKKLCPTVQT